MSGPLLSPRDALNQSPAAVQRIERAYYYNPGSMVAPQNQTPTNASMCSESVMGNGKPSPAASFAGLAVVPRDTAIVYGNGNPQLAQSVAALLGVGLHDVSVSQYSSGEVSVRIAESVLDCDVYIIQTTSSNEVIDINTALLELLLLIRKMRLGNARRITAVIPFLAYARQDRKTGLRVPISASAVAEMIVQMGVDRVVTMELHSMQIQGFFNNVPVDNLQVCYEFAKYIQAQPWFDASRTAMVSPDAGGVERARVLADILGVPHVVTIVKRRVKAGQVDTMQTVGDVAGFHCVIVDDMCDTGGTLVKACELLASMGACDVVACCAHGILTDPCCSRVNQCNALRELVVTDSIGQDLNAQRCPKLRVLTIAPLLATAIRKLSHDESLSSLFQGNHTAAPQ